MVGDQAQALRRLCTGAEDDVRDEGGVVVPIDRARGGVKPLQVRTIAMTSGKGGVGKTNMCASLAVSFARQGARVLAVDGDLGMANLDIILGVTPEHTLVDALQGACGIQDALVEGPYGVKILPACSGRYEIANLSDNERHGLFTAIDTLENQFDVLLIDTAAGIGSNSVAFASAAQDIVLIATPEPTSLADAYAMMKVLVKRQHVSRVRVVANMVASPREGEEVFRRLSLLADRFLEVGMDYLGFVYRDDAVAMSIGRHTPFVLGFPHAPASRCVESIASKLLENDVTVQSSGGIGLFWRRLLEQKETVDR